MSKKDRPHFSWLEQTMCRFTKPFWLRSPSLNTSIKRFAPKIGYSFVLILASLAAVSLAIIHFFVYASDSRRNLPIAI